MSWKAKVLCIEKKFIDVPIDKGNRPIPFFCVGLKRHAFC